MDTTVHKNSNAEQNLTSNEETLETIKTLQDLVIIQPNNPEILMLLAASLENNQQIDEAIEIYKKAVNIKKDAHYIYKKLADLYYLVKNNPTEAIKYCKKCLEYDPENLDAKACLSIAYLKSKNYEEGWKYFKYRAHKSRAIAKRGLDKPTSKPLWQGENIKNKTLYVYTEAGLGDTMMFARFLPELKQKCKKVIFEAEKCTQELYKNSNLDVEIITPEDIANINYDLHTPLMSLPYLLNLQTEQELLREKYLIADKEKIKFYKEKYFQNNNFKIGIKWQGMAIIEKTRKIPLKEFYKILDLKNSTFYSLQKGDGIEELQDAKDYNIVDLGTTFNDFSDTAGAIENCDLIICNDTSVAHLAGALGKECWILLPFNQDWRWGTDLDNCAWYKSAKLFKQNSPGNWAEVFDSVKKELILKWDK